MCFKRLMLAVVLGASVGNCSLPPKPIPMPRVPMTSSGPPTVLAFLQECEGLAHSGMNYKFGGDEPSEGGFDCSGTIHYLLNKQGYRGLPRQANHFYQWLDQAGTLTKVRKNANADSVYRRLRPGDLLFWKGTYKTRRNPTFRAGRWKSGISRPTAAPDRRIASGAKL